MKKKKDLKKLKFFQHFVQQIEEKRREQFLNLFGRELTNITTNICMPSSEQLTVFGRIFYGNPFTSPFPK